MLVDSRIQKSKRVQRQRNRSINIGLRWYLLWYVPTPVSVKTSQAEWRERCKCSWIRTNEDLTTVRRLQEWLGKKERKQDKLHASDIFLQWLLYRARRIRVESDKRRTKVATADVKKSIKLAEPTSYRNRQRKHAHGQVRLQESNGIAKTLTRDCWGDYQSLCLGYSTVKWILKRNSHCQPRSTEYLPSRRWLLLPNLLWRCIIHRRHSLLGNSRRCKNRTWT